MITFKEYLLEASEHNSAFGDAYETATILHIHHNTGSAKNSDPIYKAKIAAVKAKHDEAMSKLPADIKKRALDAGKESAGAYVKSLKDNHGVEAHHVSEVHHTSKGISELVGHHVPQNEAQHDLVVKYNTGKKEGLHGASLKATAGTASNNTPGIVDRLKDHYAKHAKASGLDAVPKDKKKEHVAKDPEKFKKAGHTAQVGAAAIHVKEFGKMSLEDQRSHVHKLMRHSESSPVPLDYVKGGHATPYGELPHVKAASMSKKFSIEQHGNRTHIYGHGPNGEKSKLLDVEHRFTHGVDRQGSPQVNAKFA